MIPIGLVGFGLLGEAFAKRLKAAGLSVRGFDVDQHRRTEMIRHGVAGAALRDLAATCECLVAAVYSGSDVADVIKGLAAAVSCVPRVVTVVCCTTLDPDSVVRLAASANASGLGFLEFPVSGTSAQVAQGLGLGLCAGADDLAAAHRDLLEVLTPRLLHLGPIGTAAKMKLAINLVLEVNRTALAEGMFFAERPGLDLVTFEEALRASAAYSRVLDGKCTKLRTGDFSPEGRLTQSLKDVAMMQAEAAKCGFSLPMTQLQGELLAACAAAGDGDLDATAVILELRRLVESPRR